MSEEIIDIEAFSKENKPVPKGAKYKIKVDTKDIIVEQSTISGKNILELAGKVPYTKWSLNQRLKGGAVLKVGYDQIIDLTAPGIEKFQTLPLDQIDGEELRKQFSLPEEDCEYLNHCGSGYETIIEQNNHWLIISDFKVPEGYNFNSAKLALLIDHAYPVTQIDMAYFYPALSLKNNRTINNLSNQNIAGQIYQRWSRHRTAENPWRPGIDDISTHMSLVTYWLERELTK